MEHIKQKKKPAAKLEQIIIPDKEKSSTTKPDIQPDIQPITQQVSNELVKVEVEPVTKQLKKRGRKRKIPIDIKYTNTDYIVMWPEICMAQKVLVDRYDNVYTYDLNSPLWLGVKTAFGKIDNVTHKAPLTKYYFQ
jgi:hypothetical protein